MRKIFAFIMTTLDGYYAGLDQEFDFWVVDEEFNEFAVEQLGKIDTLRIRAGHVRGDGRVLADTRGGAG